MAISPNFIATESLADNNLVTFTDTSTGDPTGLTSRRISVKLANGNWLTEGGVESSTIQYITWNIADLSITVDLLVQSTVANVTVDWLTNTTVTYTKPTLIIWCLYFYVFALGLISNMTSSPSIIQDSNFYSNYFAFITNIFNAETCVTYGSDIYSAQGAINVNQNMINNASYYF